VKKSATKTPSKGTKDSSMSPTEDSYGKGTSNSTSPDSMEKPYPSK
jgi:hypothetical protein